MELHKDTVSNLKFISRIQVGEKINLKRMSIQTDNVFTTLIRSIFYDENRNKTLSFVQDTVHRTFDIIKCYEHSTLKSDVVMRSNIVSDLTDCTEGLQRLKETYHDDLKFACDIDTVIQLIKSKLSDIED